MSMHADEGHVIRCLQAGRGSVGRAQLTTGGPGSELSQSRPCPLAAMQQT
jgi:hypothetical protein